MRPQALFNDEASFTETFHKVNSLYLRKSTNESSHTYSTTRQHNLAPLSSVMNGSKTYLESAAVKRFLTYKGGITPDLSVDAATSSATYTKPRKDSPTLSTSNHQVLGTGSPHLNLLEAAKGDYAEVTKRESKRRDSLNLEKTFADNVNTHYLHYLFSRRLGQTSTSKDSTTDLPTPDDYQGPVDQLTSLPTWKAIKKGKFAFTEDNYTGILNHIRRSQNFPLVFDEACHDQTPVSTSDSP